MYGHTGSFVSRCEQSHRVVMPNIWVTLRLRIGDHRAQLAIGDGAIVITTEQKSSARSVASVMVRVDDVHRHSVTAIGHGARLISLPTDYPYGERQYTVEDIAGHRWTFSQTVSDSDPEEWGGS
jgi:uncharacterized glyoxalase superfamily protein PhnB